MNTYEKVQELVYNHGINILIDDSYFSDECDDVGLPEPEFHRPKHGAYNIVYEFSVNGGSEYLGICYESDSWNGPRDIQYEMVKPEQITLTTYVRM